MDEIEWVYQREAETYEWVRSINDTVHYGFRCAGMKRNGEYVAAILLDRFDAVECQIHIASAPGVMWATPEACRRAFTFAFKTMGRWRLTSEPAVSNSRAVRLNRHLGFVEEGLKRHACADGGDRMVFGMLRDECRWIKEPQ
jgi:RimJ/RimL family protein N-acetyltransferase